MKALLLILTPALLASAADYPDAEIASRLIHAKIMLPDAQRGSYRGTRFDWSGIVTSLQFAGHEYFGQWYDRHDPKIHDAITGPVEEFRTNDAGPGYDQAKPGGTFVRIGVGSVRKPDEKAYRLFATYDIVDAGKRSLRHGHDWIEFTHELASEGYGYRYRKTLRLDRDHPRLTIEHSLKNTGTKPIDSVQYNHNFFVIDHETVGPDMAIRFPFAPRPVQPLANGGEVRGEELVYARELQKGESVFTDVKGFGQTTSDYDFRIENRKSGAGVRITGDRPLAQLYFWSIRTVACPEPYIHLHVDPGQETRWKIMYDFYTMPR